MKRLINSKRQNLATVASNMVFDFIRQSSLNNVAVFSIKQGIGACWQSRDKEYRIDITSKELTVLKKLPGGIVRHRESRLVEGIKLIEKTLKEIEQIF